MSRKKTFRIIRWIIILSLLTYGIKIAFTKTPEQIILEEKIEAVTLDGRVEEFEIEGRDHIAPDTTIEYQTNPPTSGGHLAEAEKWGVYDEEIDDKAAIHSLEHGGIWISYKDLEQADKEILEEIGRSNALSTVISPRSTNDDTLVIASWGRMMRLDSLDHALIQKYIDTYKNQSPEKLAQ